MYAIVTLQNVQCFVPCQASFFETFLLLDTTKEITQLHDNIYQSIDFIYLIQFISLQSQMHGLYRVGSLTFGKNLVKKKKKIPVFFSIAEQNITKNNFPNIVQPLSLGRWDGVNLEPQLCYNHNI